MKAPAGSYLIAGLPRCRLAWLAGLMFSDEMPCYHDNPTELDQLVRRGAPFGFSSASLIAAMPEVAVQVFAECPIVVVERPALESRRALEKWVGFSLPNWHVIEDRFEWFMRQVPKSRLLAIESRDLDDYAVANKVHEHCLGRALSRDKFNVFNLLKVEQHLPKVSGASSWPGSQQS